MNTNTQNFEYHKKSIHLTFYAFSNNKFNNNLFYKLGKISKNIYNSTIYSIQVFNTFKFDLYKNLYNDLLINNNINISEYINKKLSKYHDIYSDIKKKIDHNNKFIYKYIINDIKFSNIIVKNINYEELINFYKVAFKYNNDIFKDTEYNKILIVKSY